MKKRMLIGFISIIAVVVCATPIAFATTEATITNDISSAEKIIDVLNEEIGQEGAISNKERKEIINSATPDAIIEYNEVVQTEVEELLENEKFALPAGKNYFSDSFILDCGAEVQIKLEDKEEKPLLQGLFKKASNLLIDEVYAVSLIPSSGSSMWKDYGDRYFTATMKIYGQGEISWSFENHYTISKTGLTLRKGIHRTGYNGFIRNVETWHTAEDKYATAVGHDIHYKATVQWNESTVANMIGFDYLLGPFQRDMRSVVKIEKWDKANKRMYLTQYNYFL